MKGRGTGGSPAKEPPKKNRRKPKPGHNRAAQAVEHLIEVVREKLALLGHFLAFIVLFIATPIRRLAVAIFSGVAWVARQLSHLGTGWSDFKAARAAAAKAAAAEAAERERLEQLEQLQARQRDAAAGKRCGSSSKKQGGKAAARPAAATLTRRKPAAAGDASGSRAVDTAAATHAAATMHARAPTAPASTSGRSTGSDALSRSSSKAELLHAAAAAAAPGEQSAAEAKQQVQQPGAEPEQQEQQPAAEPEQQLVQGSTSEEEEDEEVVVPVRVREAAAAGADVHRSAAASAAHGSSAAVTAGHASRQPPSAPVEREENNEAASSQAVGEAGAEAAPAQTSAPAPKQATQKQRQATEQQQLPKQQQQQAKAHAPTAKQPSRKQGEEEAPPGQQAADGGRAGTVGVARASELRQRSVQNCQQAGRQQQPGAAGPGSTGGTAAVGPSPPPASLTEGQGNSQTGKTAQRAGASALRKPLPPPLQQQRRQSFDGGAPQNAGSSGAAALAAGGGPATGPRRPQQQHRGWERQPLQKRTSSELLRGPVAGEQDLAGQPAERRQQGQRQQRHGQQQAQDSGPPADGWVAPPMPSVGMVLQGAPLQGAPLPPLGAAGTAQPRLSGHPPSDGSGSDSAAGPQRARAPYRPMMAQQVAVQARAPHPYGSNEMPQVPSEEGWSGGLGPGGAQAQPPPGSLPPPPPLGWLPQGGAPLSPPRPGAASHGRPPPLGQHPPGSPIAASHPRPFPSPGMPLGPPVPDWQPPGSLLQEPQLAGGAGWQPPGAMRHPGSSMEQPRQQQPVSVTWQPGSETTASSATALGDPQPLWGQQQAAEADAGAEQPDARGWGSYAGALGDEAVAEQGPQVALLPVSGLSNEAGEYNCFLNAILQCLWHCAEFRRQVAAWPDFIRGYNSVLRAVHGVFSELEREEREGGQQQRSNGKVGGAAVLAAAGPNGAGNSAAAAAAGEEGGAPPGSRRSVVNPNQLREALSELPGELFKEGEMNDAGEVLQTIYDQINQAVAAARAFSRGQEGDLAGGVDLAAVLGLDVHEYVYCQRCDKNSHDSRYTQYMYNTQATALREMRRVRSGSSSAAGLGQLLHLIEQQTRKSCDLDQGGCNSKLPVVHALERAPRVFTLQLGWGSQREDPADIAATLAAVSEKVDLSTVYRGLSPGDHVYRLRSLVCYYGAHYFAFVRLGEPGSWAMIDDAKVSQVGTWADVRKKCELGRVQPSVLFLEEVDGPVA